VPFRCGYPYHLRVDRQMTSRMQGRHGIVGWKTAKVELVGSGVSGYLEPSSGDCENGKGNATVAKLAVCPS